VPSSHPAARAERSERSARGERPLTLTERARREQLIQVTIEQVARHGYAGTSLARIAEAAGISKAAVLYHFPSKAAVVQAAYATVIDGLVEYVGAAVEAAAGAGRLAAYIRSLVAYLTEHPERARMIIEAMTGESGVTDTPGSPIRQRTVADLVEAAVAAGDYRSDTGPRQVAVIVNGALDAIVSERLTDAAFDAAGAAEQLIAMVDRALRADR